MRKDNGKRSGKREAGPERADAVIIGGGASGLAAAVTLAETLALSKKSRESRGRCPRNIIVLEKMDEPGRKILASGNGRCNLSNRACPDWKNTDHFFRHIGVLTRTDEAGRMYPYSEDAKSVRDALVRKLRILGVEIRTSSQVESISQMEDTEYGFRIRYSWDFSREKHKRKGDADSSKPSGASRRILDTKLLLLSSGGKAGPAFGTSGDGAIFARSLGHTVTRLVPALTAVETKEDLHACAGARAKVRLTLLYKGMKKGSWDGECQFTSYGISGICVFDLSRALVIPEGKKSMERKDIKTGLGEYRVQIDFLPETAGILDSEKLLRSLFGEKVDEVDLSSIVRKNLAEHLLREEGTQVSPGRAAEILKTFSVTPKNLKGWEKAQVTRGGVLLSEVNPDTGSSKFVPGLYFSGEILDYDGPCGGFNLNHAWQSGIRAGRAMADVLLKMDD
ncbi:MAG: NAD(P)/FAD-dependent oxidoreductase [Eubacteriales bacterium]|nr:NAD(P)/FAD-dependent oxidoreductase [Eubacteriales bacterium]